MRAGATREEALECSRRALAEFEVDGIATALTFHRVVVEDPAFAPANGEPFTVHTRWIETGFDNQIPAYTGAGDGMSEPQARETVVLEAMKMEQPLTAHKAGTVANIAAEVGATVSSAAPILDIV